MDLWTLRRKLIDGDYTSVQEYKRDFRLIIDNALQWHGRGSEIAKDVQSLHAKFEEKMTTFSMGSKRDSEYTATNDSSSSASPDRGPLGTERDSEDTATSDSSTSASPDSAPGDEPPRQTRELPPRAAKSAVQTYRTSSLRDHILYRKHLPFV